MTKNLNLFNTLSRKKEKFVPIDYNKIGMYVCGPTVYDFPHIGNARPLVVFDVLFRLLKTIYGKNKVTYVRNITDVDDKIIESSKKNKKTKLIKVVKEIDENIKRYASRTENIYGSGGMKTKIEAAKICQLSGCYMVITNGTHENPIKKINESQKCTWFLPKISKLDARKQWIIGSVAPRGEVIIDHGAIIAINNGKSLLPAGVKKINGTFEKGDHILVKDQNNIECARGLTSFSSIEIEKIKGSHSSEIKNILGYSSREEIIHKDDLAKV